MLHLLAFLAGFLITLVMKGPSPVDPVIMGLSVLAMFHFNDFMFGWFETRFGF